MKKKYIFSLLVFISAIVIVILYIYSNRNANVKNGFIRTFSREHVILKEKIALENEIYSIAGVTGDSIALYNYRKPYEWINIIDGHKKNKVNILPFMGKEKFDGMNTLTFDEDCSFLLSGMTATVYKVCSDQKVKSSRLDSIPFYQSIQIGSNSFAFISKIKYKGLFRRKLKKSNWQGKELSGYLPEKQFDGYFCTDGQFRYYKNSRLLVYMYYYRGHFTCLDTNLNVVYQAKTIDTVKYAKIHLKHVKNMVIHATPPNIVNKRFCMTNEKVYIQSNLKADNQNGTEFNDTETIDVYNLRDGKYSFSFCLPKVEKLKLTEFSIYKNTLIALYKNNLAIYNIPKF